MRKCSPTCGYMRFSGHYGRIAARGARWILGHPMVKDLKANSGLRADCPGHECLLRAQQGLKPRQEELPSRISSPPPTPIPAASPPSGDEREDGPDVDAAVAAIIAECGERGDAAVIDYTAKFDQPGADARLLLEGRDRDEICMRSRARRARTRRGGDPLSLGRCRCWRSAGRTHRRRARLALDARFRRRGALRSRANASYPPRC